jgi:hypothetical protein
MSFYVLLNVMNSNGWKMGAGVNWSVEFRVWLPKTAPSHFNEPNIPKIPDHEAQTENFLLHNSIL